MSPRHAETIVVDDITSSTSSSSFDLMNTESSSKAVVDSSSSSRSSECIVTTDVSENNSNRNNNEDSVAVVVESKAVSPTRRLARARQRFARDLRQRSRVFFENRREMILQQRSRIIIVPADHPLKITWDIFTVLLTFFSAYSTHMSIRDRNYSFNSFGIFTELWLLVDLLLNFVTEHRSSDGQVSRDQKVVWARYLTTWFAIDALSLIPWERVYVKPVIEMQNKRNIFKKSFFRTKAVIRVTRFLRGKHFRYFGKVVNNTKHVGVGAHRLLRLIIKYVPKYILFYKNMRGVLAVRTLRQIHILRKLSKRIGSSSQNQTTTTNLDSSSHDKPQSLEETQ